LGAGGLHRRVKNNAFQIVWAMVGFTAGSKPSHFAVFERWWASPLGQNHRAGGAQRRVKTIAFHRVWVLVELTAGSKPSDFLAFARWWASPPRQNHCVS
jgi:hypothetical protein